MVELRFRHTDVLDRTLEGLTTQTFRYVVNEGGTGSSKTWSVLQAHVVLSFQEEGKLYTVVRDSLPTLKRSALRDFEAMLAETGAVSFFDVNRSDLTFTNRLTGTAFEFTAFDTPQKARGPRRDRLIRNEVNEITEETGRQLAMRTRLSIADDFNPSMLRHWIYDKILTRSDCLHVKSTYRDNVFLSADEVREIEADVPVYQEADGALVTDWALTYTGSGHLVKGDPYRWAVFGLGERGSPTEAIYPYTSTGPMPDAPSVLGLDFGYNHPMVLVRVARVDVLGARPCLHVDELVFGSYLLTEDLIDLLPGAGVSKHERIWCDAARPDEIKKLQRAGYNAAAAPKGAGSVYAGVTWVKGHSLEFTPRSERSRNQCEGYRWKKHADGTILDEPVKLDDDAPDAIRYGAFSEWSVPQPQPRIRALN